MGGGIIRIRMPQRRATILAARRWIIGGVTGTVLIVAAGNAIQGAVSSTSPPASGTMVVDLVLPATAEAPALPEPSADAETVAAPEPSSHPRPGPAADGLAGPSSPPPAAAPPASSGTIVVDLVLPATAEAPALPEPSADAETVAAPEPSSHPRPGPAADGLAGLSSPPPAAAPPASSGTIVVDLVLPATAEAPALPEPSADAETVAAPEPSPHPRPGPTADGLAGPSSPPPAAAPPASSGTIVVDLVLPATVEAPALPEPSTAAAPVEPGPEMVAAARIEPSVPATAAPASAVGTVAPADTESLPTKSPPAGIPAHKVRVERGDSLYLIFKRLGLSQGDLARMTASKPLRKKLARIAPGQEIEFYTDAESRLMRLVHRSDLLRSLHVSRDGDAFAFEEIVETPDVSMATATGVIESSLFEAGQRAGLSDKIIMQMTEIFAWDVDFALDIRVGDQFALIFEERFKDREKVGEGPIAAAEFTNRGRRIRAVRYVDATGRSGYFSPDGRSMRKAFLRTPVNFTRISSRFNLKRRHPILHKIRAHRGVDYAAPRGTAVKASGDGKVIFAGRKGGYGRTVVVQHGSVYTTLYAHLSRFPKGIRSGKRVRQGQTIGYVGSTGLATGPHLHYEFRVRGVHRDPLKVKLPKAAPLAKKYMVDFREKVDPLLAKLDLLDTTSVATAD